MWVDFTPQDHFFRIFAIFPLDIDGKTVWRQSRGQVADDIILRPLVPGISVPTVQTGQKDISHNGSPGENIPP